MVRGASADQGEVSGLSLDDNNLVGTLPPELGGLDELFGLVLRYNELSGPIPAELSKFDGLRDLFLADNPGSTAGCLPELGYAGRLEYLSVNGTRPLPAPCPLPSPTWT